MQIYLTGSSAKLLSKEIASSLRGRTIIKEIFPFSFKEYLNSFNVAIPQQFGTAQRVEQSSFAEFFALGRISGDDRNNTWSASYLATGYTASVIYRDIVERYNISNVQVLNQLLAHCVRNSATVFSINKIYHTLKSTATRLAKIVYMNSWGTSKMPTVSFR